MVRRSVAVTSGSGWSRSTAGTFQRWPNATCTHPRARYCRPRGADPGRCDGPLPGEPRRRALEVQRADRRPADPAVRPVRSDHSFDRYARLVQHALAVPVALVSLVETERQWFPGAVGLPEPWATCRETPLSHSFCQHVVATREPLVVTDARQDPRVAGNLAIEDLGVIAYAGHPITDHTGEVIGSLCAIGHEPREWQPHELDVLRDLADACSTELAQRGQRLLAAEEARRSRELSHRSQVLLSLSQALAETQTTARHRGRAHPGHLRASRLHAGRRLAAQPGAGAVLRPQPDRGDLRAGPLRRRRRGDPRLRRGGRPRVGGGAGLLLDAAGRQQPHRRLPGRRPARRTTPAASSRPTASRTCAPPRRSARRGRSCRWPPAARCTACWCCSGTRSVTSRTTNGSRSTRWRRTRARRSSGRCCSRTAWTRS